MVPAASMVVGVICPKCQNVMQTVDRLGVHIEQCAGCRGIFLDRGELEQIAGAEQRHYSAAPPAYQPEPSRGYRDSPPRGHGKRKRRGFLEELFD